MNMLGVLFRFPLALKFQPVKKQQQQQAKEKEEQDQQQQQHIIES